MSISFRFRTSMHLGKLVDHCKRRDEGKQGNKVTPYFRLKRNRLVAFFPWNSL